jgi:hypothetical protein
MSLRKGIDEEYVDAMVASYSFQDSYFVPFLY